MATKRHRPSAESEPAEATYGQSREYLIETLAVLIVRQHRRLDALDVTPIEMGAGNDPIQPVEVEATDGSQ